MPELKYFSQATGFSSTERDICEMERFMIRLFGYKLHRVTFQSWTEVYSKKWDQYANCYNMHQFTDNGNISLRQFATDSYLRFRQIYDIVDALALTFESLWID